MVRGIGKFYPPPIPLYEWMDRLSFSFMLESFVFISGYVYGFQSVTRGRKGFSEILRTKFKRLIIPSVLFSIAYLVCYQPLQFSNIQVVYEVFNGVAHMWFLPMLFWCFVIMTVIEPYLDRCFGLIVILSIALALFSFLPFPFRLNNSFYYFPFFLIGLSCWKNKKIRTLSVSKVTVFELILAFLSCFVVLTMVNKHLAIKATDSSLITRIIFLFLMTAGKLFYSCMGVLLVYLMMKWIKNKDIKLKAHLVKISELCFGVYLLQQFILVYLYDYTGLTIKMGLYIIPWVFFGITLVLSLLLSWLIRQSRIGKQLI